MQITANDAKASFSGDARLLDDDAIAELSTCEFTRKQVRRVIDNLSVSADAKVWLHSILEKSIVVVTAAGNIVIWIGRKILDIVLFLLREFPNATFGVIFGLVVGHLIGLIPIIGFLMGPLVGATLAAFGLLQGVAQDMRDQDIRRRVVERIHSQFTDQNMREQDIQRRVAEICRQFTALQTEPA